jgi:hypothetical protein
MAWTENSPNTPLPKTPQHAPPIRLDKQPPPPYR